MTQIPGRVPSIGSVVWCYFPLEKGPPRHPCLVLAVDSDNNGLDWLTVSIGTSVFDPDGTHRLIYDTDLVLYAADHGFTGKSLHATKFSFLPRCIRAFPYTMDHFYVPPGQAWPKIGNVDFAEPKVADRLAEINEATDIAANVDAARSAVAKIA